MIALTSVEGSMRIWVLRGDMTTVRLEGELDFGSVDIVEAAARLVPEWARVVTVDLGGLTFVDAEAADTLAAFHAAQEVRGRKVRLSHARPCVRRVFGILGTESLLSPPQSQERPRSPRHHRRPDWLRTTPLWLGGHRTGLAPPPTP